MPKPFTVEIIPGRPIRDGFRLHAGSDALARDPAERHLRGDRAECFSDPGPRTWDHKMLCYVAAPKADISRLGNIAPRRSGPVHLPDGSGKFWWISCAVTGYRLILIEALHREAAVAEAGRLYPSERVTIARGEV